MLRILCVCKQSFGHEIARTRICFLQVPTGEHASTVRSRADAEWDCRKTRATLEETDMWARNGPVRTSERVMHVILRAFLRMPLGLDNICKISRVGLCGARTGPIGSNRPVEPYVHTYGSAPSMCIKSLETRS